MTIMRSRFYFLCVLVSLLCWHHLAHAARTFTNAQNPAAGTGFAMGSSQSLTYQITNTATGGNAGERIYEMRFRINSGSLFSASTAAPAGWTRTAFSTTSVTFRATSWSNAIAVAGAPVGFTLVIVMRSTTADATTERLRDMRARFTNTTTGPPFTRLASVTTNTPGLWTLKSLSITTFQITDLAGVPITALTGGTSFQLRMIVRNNSTITQTPIIANPNPPTPFKTGTVTQTLTGTAGSPLNLAAGASGTIIFTYSTVATDNGTIYFTAAAQRSATVTSSTATSTTLAVSRFNVSLAASSTCLYTGFNLTVTMTIANNTGANITGITGSLTPLAGAPVTYVSGPTPASIASMATATTATVNWTYTINSTGATNPFSFSGSANSTGPALTTPTATSAPVTRGIFAVTVSPASTNAGSTNTELTFDVTNNGCANVNSVAVTAPAGWIFGGDAYSLVSLSAISDIETWTTGGVNPVTFTAPNVAGQLPFSFAGGFALVYSATAATTNFSVTVTDTSPGPGPFSIIVPVTITVNPFKTGPLNDATNKIWREDFR